jgi:hypothetical protein
VTLQGGRDVNAIAISLVVRNNPETAKVFGECIASFGTYQRSIDLKRSCWIASSKGVLPMNNRLVSGSIRVHENISQGLAAGTNENPNAKSVMIFGKRTV